MLRTMNQSKLRSVTAKEVDDVFSFLLDFLLQIVSCVEISIPCFRIISIKDDKTKQPEQIRTC